MKIQTLLDLSAKKDIGHWDSADFVFKRQKKDKKNLKHLKSSKITEGPALCIVDHSTHTQLTQRETFSHPSLPPFRPLS